MSCISRWANKKYIQKFGDGRHIFYFEFRCNRPCIENSKHCKYCQNKSTDAVHQFFLSYDHGDINEPIPDHSHIYGGNWYNDAVKKYGEPPSEIIEYAIQYQKEARGEFIIENIKTDEPYKAIEPSISQDMPRPKKIIEESSNNEDNSTVKPLKRARKPKVSIPIEGNEDNTQENLVNDIKPLKKTRKPKVATTEDITKPEPKKRTNRKKTIESPTSNIITPNNSELTHKEVALPTHLENTIEEFDTEEFEIEYVKLTIFEANGTTYYRDIKKNKLYKKIKDKGIGPYIGRWNPDTDSIITNIPDSDDEE
jgi:hypothetical protein